MKKSCLFILFILAASPNLVTAESLEEKGMAIAVEADKRDQGFGDTKADLVMILRNASGDESQRQLRSRTLEVADDGDKSLTIFDSPRDVKGTAFLSFTHPLEADDQWLFLPALKRVKRISSANKSGPFMGSEFAYEDMTSYEVAKYSYKYLKNEEIDGEPCFVVAYLPAYEHSGYTQLIVWLDQAEYRLQKIEYYDRKNALLKTQQFFEYQQYKDHYWRANRALMTNHQTGKSTELIWRDIAFDNGFTARDFDSNSLKRAR